MAQHFEDCHRSPKNFPGSLSKLGTTSLFYPRYCKAYVGEQRGRAPGLREVGRGRILKLLASPVPSSACTSCESAVRGLDRRTTPSLSTKSLAGDAAVVPPETGAGGGAREGVAGTWELESICRSRKQTRELSPQLGYHLWRATPSSQPRYQRTCGQTGRKEVVVFQKPLAITTLQEQETPPS